jgi:ATP-binding cassette subfamily F protein uup
VVSHDRYFLDRTIEKVFRFEPGGNVREFAGDYSAYLEAVEREDAARKPADLPKSKAAAQPVSADGPQPKKLSFKENRELEQLEKSIAAAEARLPAIEKELALAASDAGRVHELFTEQQTLESQLDADMTRWAELAERAETK